MVLLANARAHSRCDVVRGHVGTPPYVPYLRRARTPRHWSDHRSWHNVGVNSPVTSVASGSWQVAPIHQTGAHPRRAIGRRGDARRRPHRGLSTRACVTGVTSPLHNRPSPTISRPPRPLPRAHTQPPPSSAARHWRPLGELLALLNSSAA
jgi:hypothetical protein